MSAALAPSVDAFLAYLRVERRYSPSTIDHYGRALGALVAYAESHKIARWRELRPDQVQALLAGEHRRGLAPASLRGLASAWRSFFRYLAREGEVAINPATGVRSPR
ncbi:MAG TPA: site-specific integrase, partial [Rhodanobacteraceae bacterium]